MAVTAALRPWTSGLGCVSVASALRTCTHSGRKSGREGESGSGRGTREAAWSTRKERNTKTWLEHHET